MTQEGDLVLAHIRNKPAFFARIENIDSDIKPGWFQVKMLVLQVPLVTITWILRDTYINGEEFTMGGHPVKLDKVIAPETNSAHEKSTATDAPELPPLDGVAASEEELHEPPAAKSAPTTKVVSLMERKKKNST
ncbi:MAG TPA: hypothetical protein DCZ69_05350 [Syntrophobacteraceae bacterium]|nr:hypothetical protein [Syntrophobacteraceae bacterium]HBD07666.1 hypothetical protein [Syntrophobacteraceae bacterium]HBZ53952.1 hypothetical protein [Syntrophobacteraceae bacterium]